MGLFFYALYSHVNHLLKFHKKNIVYHIIHMFAMCMWVYGSEMHINVHCYIVEAKRKIQHQMFTIQIFCSYSINYKTFKLICNENKANGCFFLVYEHSILDNIIAHCKLKIRTINRNWKKIHILWWFAVVFAVAVFLLDACKYVYN